MSAELRDNLIKTRQQLLARSQTWRDDFAGCTSKIKDLAATTSTVVGEIVGCNSYMLERMAEQETTMIKVREGISLSNDLATAATAEVAQATNDVQSVTSKLTKFEKDVKDIGNVSRASLKAAQTVQLRESRNSIIVRGLASVTKSGVKETYEDMQAAFHRVLKQAKVPHLRINDLRRLPKVKNAKADIPASMEVEFVTGGGQKEFLPGHNRPAEIPQNIGCEDQQQVSRIYDEGKQTPAQASPDRQKRKPKHKN